MAALNSILSGSLVFRDRDTYLSEIRPGPNAITVTGSLNVSGSRITFNGSDLVERITTLESGQGADQVKFGAITVWSASMNDWSASVKDSIGELDSTTDSLNLFSGSAQSQLDTLSVDNAIQASRISLLEVSGSDEEVRLSFLESKSIISSSTQISSFGFLTASIGGIVSSSAQISRLGFITGSKFRELDDIPSGIVSSSTQIVTYLQDRPLDLGTAPLTASYLQVTDNIELAGEDVLAFIQNKNVFSLTGSYGYTNKDVKVEGSLDLNFNGVTNYFSININGEEKVKVNEEGILQLFAHGNEPTPVEGGLFFGDDDNLYLGVND